MGPFTTPLETPFPCIKITEYPSLMIIQAILLSAASGGGNSDSGASAVRQTPLLTRRFCLKIILKELLQSGGVGLLVPALNGDGDGLALLDPQAHQGHQFGAHAGFAVGLGDGNGAVLGLDRLDQQPGGTGVDAYGVGDGVSELLVYILNL